MRKRLAILPILAMPMLAAADTAPASDSSSTDQLITSLFQGCWSCGVFNTLGAIGLDFADKVYTNLASGMTILVGLGLAFWILLFAARLLLPFGPPPASGHWNSGAVKLFKCAVVLAFLAGSGPFWNYVFTPILSIGLGIASQLTSESDQYETPYGTASGVPAGTVDYCQGPIPAPKITLSAAVQPALTAFEQIDCPLSHMQGEYGKGIMIGVAVMGQTMCKKSMLQFMLGDRSVFGVFLAGLVLIIAYLWGFLVFPLLLIDSLARVILVAALSPLAVASILFKQTARIAERSIWSLVHCGFTLMFGAAVAGLGKALIAYVLSEMTNTPGAPQLTNWSTLSNTMENACNAGFVVDFTTSSFYMLLGTAVITTFMMRRAASLAGELTGVAGSVGAKDFIASTAGAVANVAGTAAGGAAKLAYKNLARRVSGRGE